MNRLAMNTLLRSTPVTRRALALLATAAAAASLVVSAAQASTSEWPYDAVAYDDTEAVVAFEENFPLPFETDYALSLELPADYFAAPTFPPMASFGEEEPRLMLAGLDPLQTP
ncbi:MAG TPA: hypothetical protein PLR35_08190 [Burkholderiaceae bacterium]|nr:hypothetical protein [Burkholderiaceae bacterium]